MRRVFLVEDEIVVRESIRDHVPWGQSGFVLVGEAADGEMALPLIEETRPDILITDIKMPFLDGLALSRIVRKSFPWVKIILISGYDEFALARQAIGIGVTDYLLKPLSSGDLLKSLEKVDRQIEQETEEKEKADDLAVGLRNSMQAMTERFLSDLATGLVPPEEALERARRFELDLLARHYIVAVVTPTVTITADGRTTYAEHLKVERCIGGFVEGNAEVLKFSPNLRQTVLIFKGDDPAALERTCYSLCHALKYEVERTACCSLTASIGSVRERIQGIAESFREASAAARFDYIFGDSAVIGITDTQRAKLKGDVLMPPDGGAILECLKRGERSGLAAARDGFLGDLRAARQGPFLTGYAVLAVIVSTARFMEELGCEVGSLLEGMADLQRLVRDEDWAGMGRLLDTILGTAFDARERRRENKYAGIVDQARRFIAANFASSDISLNVVAEHVHVSPSHFSTIFSQEAGQTFIEFLTETRMAKSKELLKTTSLRSSEIAYAVGYKDPHYFSYIFKSKAGLTPTEFRQGEND